MLKEELSTFYGSENFYKFLGGVVIIEGVKYFAEKAEAFWLVNDIILNCLMRRKLKHEEFIAIKTSKHKWSEGITINYENGNNEVLFTEVYAYSQLPDDGEFTFWFTNNVLLLPSEY